MRALETLIRALPAAIIMAGVFFPRSGEIRAVAIRDMTLDSLVLSGTGTDATLYTFVRAGQ